MLNIILTIVQSLANIIIYFTLKIDA
ncbi:hypothetical protein XBKQ1_1280006 [Xenorhabdus bovienii str. kraussei Quebec]|uniref:Uncharacterized protein n=2 Tax=Xenorhabdus bovienii TaxID=40576 RepID=A0A077P205_XENBV|nr:hypothetical protein XBFFR1_310132 [Xenorhabdus bovienii str. feltiae France]CDG92950.1 hypothetical protein XBFFL1_2380003 [Xenorhabdus bovienii str. feltiae Florida]CDH03335.1 hypothetical protein XBFM1_750006 [Xenorhabdus bovienii str. feltiae Moldova]CDH18455.1 hypothetical protein XBKQ1_1280006 [Xenorhabdus bovienii str. kraussei Quebec]